MAKAGWSGKGGWSAKKKKKKILVWFLVETAERLKGLRLGEGGFGGIKKNKVVGMDTGWLVRYVGTAWIGKPRLPAVLS